MKIPPDYKETPEITRNLQRIRSAAKTLERFPISNEVRKITRAKSLLKSALFSARIEGNPLDLESLRSSSKSKHNKEVQNLLKASNYLANIFEIGRDVSIDLDLVLKLHSLVMADVSDYKIGVIRNNVSAIFNASGFAVYVPPTPLQLPSLLENLFGYLESAEDSIIKAILGHYIFEKIHPFFDGNGRVGRLLLSAVLLQSDLGSLTFTSFEENLESKRDLYYETLDRSATAFLDFMAASLADSAEDTLEKLLNTGRDTTPPTESTGSLLPRREEILNIIKDHQLVNFDFIARRFTAINPRTLRYDLKSLLDKNLIVKHGTTKGVFYSPKHLVNKS